MKNLVILTMSFVSLAATIVFTLVAPAVHSIA